MKKFLSSLLIAILASAALLAQNTNEKPMKAYMVADAHLDTQWNWDIQTTIREWVHRTMTQNLYLMDNYPDYIFNFEGAVKYYWMKEYYPLEYERVKEYIATGRWHLTGSSWDANETVICSPESWIRNILLGQSYYRREFNKESTDVFLPDCFGFGYDMPTLMNHCGLIGFSTQKLGWRHNDFYTGNVNNRYPFTIGLWQGIDGSRVMMTHGFGYGDNFKDSDLSQNEVLKKNIAESKLNTVYRYYGTGDTGGSPNISSVRALEKGLKGSGPIQIISATSDQLYKDYLPYDKRPELPVADGEMTMDVHGTGCYTSQAAMKLYNRQNEHLGDASERASVMAEYLGNVKYPGKELTDDYRRFIWHQFHDDLTGTSIPRAYEFSWNDELLSLGRFSNVLTTAVNGIAGKMNTQVSGTPLVLFNNEAFQAKSVADIILPNLEDRNYVVKNENNKTVRSQLVTDSDGQRHLLVDADIPATGVAVYSMKAGGKASQKANPSARILENKIYKVTVNEKGDISSIIDKRVNKELVAEGKAIGLVVFNADRSDDWPAWEVLKETVDKEPVPVEDDVEICQIENGPVRFTIKVTKKYGESTFNQYIRLYGGTALQDRIDIFNEVEWHSVKSLLKANFPLGVSNPKATYDLGLGSIQRGNNIPQAYEVYSHEWTDLTDASGDYGVTILNDSKYGWDKPSDNTIRLSLLYAPGPNKNGWYNYQEKQDLGYHEFTYSIVGHPGQLDKSYAVEQSTLLNSPVKAFASPKHKGELGRSFSFVSSDNENVTIHALKKAEDSDEYVIRVYENTGDGPQTAHITFAGNILSASEADGTEKAKGAASFEGNKLNVNITPYSVRTYLVKLDNKPLKAVESEPVALPFDLMCFTPNGFRRAASFSERYSYAAELLPDDGITVDNVPFKFGDKEAENGVVCKGNVISLPQGKYNRIYLLAASRKGDQDVTFTIGDKQSQVTVPYYTGFIGQWGHDGHTEGYLKDSEVAYIGTHRHSPTEDVPYEFTYMFKYGFEIPEGATEIKLPDNDNVVVFSATLVNENETVMPASAMFRTNNRKN